MIYAITNERAIILEIGRKKKIQTFTADKLGNLEREENEDGSGSIVLEKIESRDSDGDRRVTEIGFYGIQNVKQVEKYLLEVVENNKK